MSILSVDQISPIGSGTTITLNATEVKTGTEITVGTGASIFSPAGNTLTLGTNNVEVLRIKNTGFVGINESSPGQRLTIGGDVQIGFNTPNDAGRQLNFNVNRGSAGQTLANINWQWNSKYVAQIRGIAGSDTTNKDDAHLAFFTSAANNLVERLRIFSDGKFGFGTGNSLSEQTMAEFSSSVGGGAIGANITIRNSSTNSVNNVAELRLKTGHGVARFYKYNTGSTVIQSHTGGASNLQLMADGASSLQLYTNATERLRITSDGSTQIASGVLQRRYESTNTAGYRYYSKAERFLAPNGGSGLNFTITGMTQGWASIRFGGYTEGNRVNFRADIAGYNAGNSGVRLYDSNEITNQASNYAGGSSCSITVTKNNASYVVNVTQSNTQGNSMAGFYYFESGGYNSVSTLTVS